MSRWIQYRLHGNLYAHSRDKALSKAFKKDLKKLTERYRARGMHISFGVEYSPTYVTDGLHGEEVDYDW